VEQQFPSKHQVQKPKTAKKRGGHLIITG